MTPSGPLCRKDPGVWGPTVSTEPPPPAARLTFSTGGQVVTVPVRLTVPMRARHGPPAAWFTRLGMNTKEPTRLIVNADDFGRSESVTLGVIEASRRGIVSSTSIVANGLAFDLAAEYAGSTGQLGVGVHLCLDEYQPVSDPSDIPTLCRPHGGFAPRFQTFLKLFIPGRIDLSEVEREWDAQIAKCVGAGVALTHLDGHGHCHVHPALLGVVQRLAKKYRITRVRLPMEPLNQLTNLFKLPRHAKQALLYVSCLRAKSAWQSHLHYPDRFYGFSTGGRLTPVELASVLGRLKPGVNELMVHVALDDDDPFGVKYHWRSADFDTVVACSRQMLETEHDISIVSYHEAW